MPVQLRDIEARAGVSSGTACLGGVFAMGVDTAEIGQSKVWGALAQLPDPLYPPPLHELRRRRRSRDAILLGPRLAAKKKTES